MRRIAQYPVDRGRAWLAELVSLALAFGVLSLLGLPLGAARNAEALPQAPPSELVGQRTATSRTFDNHDGTYTTSLYSGPVHYRDAQGAWRPISSAVVPTTDSEDYALQNEANRFRTLFKSTLANDFLALETGGGLFRVTLQNAAQVAAQKDPRRLTYPGVFSGVDLRYDLRPDGLKETLLLQNPQAPTSYRFLLTPPANARIHAARGADGSWAFYMAPHARPVFVIDAPWATENDEPDPRRRNASLAVTRIGDVFAIDLGVDATWLRAAGRQFPVRLDPTITIQPTIQDASFDFACPGCSGVVSDRLSIGTGTQGLSATTWRAALQFSLADIPAGAAISNAKLKLYFDGTCVSAPGPACGGTAHQIDVLRMANSWAPDSKTSQLSTAAITPTPSFTLPAGAPAQWMNWDITGTVQAWASGSQSNFGLLLKRTPESANASGPKPPSRNYAAEPTLGPTLQVTYNGDGGELLEPETVHSNGPELRWIPYGGPGAPPFTSYEVHRSATSSYTPSDSTRLTRIMDPGVTSYRDTTAKAGGTFTYKVVVSGVETNARTVTLPAAGQTSKVLRPDTKRGHDAYYTYRSDLIDCTNRGAWERLKVGTDLNSLWRSLLWFDLHDIPSSATVTGATLSLWHPDAAPAALTVRTHRVTAAWDEGSGVNTCTGDGATWYETKGGVRWATEGGEFDPAVVSALSIPNGQTAAWNSWTLTSLVQQWLSGSQPNHGVLLKVDDETIVAGKFLDYYSSDFGVATTLRPKLSVTYTEANPVIAPTVAIGKPAPSAQVSGSSVQITAGASDDRRVDTVDFFRCSDASSNCSTGTWVSIGGDSSEPFSTTWNSTTVVNGARSLMARATDDAGNQTSSAAVAISVGNATPPTTSIFAPANNSNVSGTVTVQANASLGVTKVEFYADGTLFATDAATPWSASWNTLDPALPAYDRMKHALTTKAYDAFGQSTTSATVNVTPINAQGTKYLADFSSITFPSRVEYVPGAPSQQQYAFDITVTNRSNANWVANDVLLRYRWFENGSTSPVFDSSPGIAVGALFSNGSSQPLHIVVEAPPLPSGVARASYQLRFDLYSSLTSSWFAAKGNKPLENSSTVGTLSAEEKLGVEPYFEYDREDLGAGMENLVNVATGNSVVRWSPLHAPGIGLSTDVQFTYNSMEGDCTANRCPLGPGWSLSVSGLTRFGHQQFTINPSSNPQTLTLLDADGTMHVFTSTDGTHWTPPAGTHLYLRQVGAQWALTSPDRITYFYTMDGQHGFPAKVTDKNGNELTFSTNPPAEVYRVGDEADSRGILNHHFDLEYNGNHNLKAISDHLGHKLLFSYDTNNHHRLSDITEEGGTNADGSPLLPRTFHFEYESQGPPGARQLISVRDPRQHTTTFVYDSADRLSTRTNRALPPEQPTTFTYPSAGVTTVTKPASRVTTYTSDTEGKVTQVARQIGTRTETTTTAWTQSPPLRHVARVTEPHDQSPNPGAYTKYTYNLNGLVTEQAVLVDPNAPGEGDDLLSRTLYDYENLPVPGGDPNALAISQLIMRTDPNGAVTPLPGDYEWTYTYDTNGNLLTTTDPTGAVTTNHWFPDGTLSSVDDANQHTTSYQSYDGNGFATQVIDAKGQITQYSYDADGLLRSMQDPRHANDTGPTEREYKTLYEYDSFHRLGRTSSPKSTRFRRGTLFWTGSDYDPNNNVIVERQAAEAPTGGPHTDTEYDFMDRSIIVTGPDRSSGLERTRYQYDEAGRLWRTTRPNGFDTPTALDFVTENTYDQLDRVVTETAYAEDGIATRKTHNCYQDNTGDLLWVTQPKANLSQAPTNCSQTNPPPTPPAYTTRYTYDSAHRQETVTEPLKGPETRISAQAYDLNGNVTAKTDELGTTTTLTYSQRDELTQTVEVFDKESNPDRTLTSLRTYDNVGNLICEAPPRAYDNGSRCAPQPPSPEQFITTYRYDAVNQLDRIALPDDTSPSNPQTYIHRRYDANGNLTLTTLPVENQELTDPPTIGDDKKTTIDYFDPGWIFSSWDHVAPIVYFDYRPEGWQSLRSPLSPTDERATFWKYFDDGLVREVNDTYNDPGSSYTYDPDGNQTTAVERRGRTRKGQTPYSIFSVHNGYDELTETRYKQDADPSFRYTNYTYDRNGNVFERWDNGTATQNGRKHELVYDESDQLLSDHDWGPDLAQNTADDQKVGFEYWPTGWQKKRTIDRGNQIPAGVRKQTVDSTYFDNGDLRTAQTRNGATQPALLESHTIEYIDNGIYLNGNRTKDTFRLQGSNGAVCDAQDCVTSYGYGPRENLTSESRSRPNTSPAQTRTYGYDLAMNLNYEHDGTAEWWYTHAGNRLTTRRTAPPEAPDPNAVDRRYFYDEWGNLTCVTTGGGSSSSCARPFGIPAPGELLETYTWDYLDRLDHATLFATEDDADYEHDPLNRVAKETETHANGVGNRRSCFTYRGVSSDVSDEAWVGTADPCAATPSTTKSYSYDAYDQRVGIKKTGGLNEGDYYYARNLHTDVSLLERDNSDGGEVTASYAYKPYGAEDSLSAGDLERSDTLNAFRFNDKRLDSGSGTLDMSARSYATKLGRFIQRDGYNDALPDIGLCLDPVTSNRYAFPGGNPVQLVEDDGHGPIQLLQVGGLQTYQVNGGGADGPPPPSYRRCGRGERTSGLGKHGWDELTGKIFYRAMRPQTIKLYWVKAYPVGGYIPGVALTVNYGFELERGPQRIVRVNKRGTWLQSPLIYSPFRRRPWTLNYRVRVANMLPEGQGDIIVEVWASSRCTGPRSD